MRHSLSLFNLSTRLFAIAFAATAAVGMEADVRLVPQLSIGSAGFEPGLAVEGRPDGDLPLVLRPVLFLSEDGHLGGGAAVLYDLSRSLDLTPRYALAIGPSVLYHNSDDHGWEAAAMATWSYDLSGGMDPWRHSIGVTGSVGILEDERNDDQDLGLSAAFFYSYRL